MTASTTRACLVGLAVLVGCRCGASKPVVGPGLPAAAPVATCAKTVGDVQVRRAGQPYFEPLAPGSVLHAGDWVRTGARAYARLAFLSGGELELLERAAVVVDLTTVTPAADGGAVGASPEIALKEGFVRGVLGGTSPLSRLTIRGKDGTELRLAPRRAGAALSYRLEQRGDGVDVAVLQGEGTLVVAGIERPVRAGQVSVVRAGASSEAVPMIDFPDSIEPGIDARFLYRPQMRIELSWTHVKAAASYEVQIARDLSFQEVEVTGETTGTGFEFTPTKGGPYVWRVASRDANARLGEYGFARRVFCEEEPPRDLLLAPTDGYVLSTSDPAATLGFSWQSAAETQTYRLVIARDDDLLRQPVVERLVTDQRTHVGDLAPGSYAWGVYAAGEVARPIFLHPRHFTIKRVGAAKLKTVKSISEWGK